MVLEINTYFQITQTFMIVADKQLTQTMEDYLAALKTAAVTREYYQVC